MTSINWPIVYLLSLITCFACQQSKKQKESYFQMSSKEVMAIEFSEPVSLVFHETAARDHPSFTIEVQIISAKGGDSLVISKPDYLGFSPLSYHKKLARLAFEVVEQKGKWIQVIINNETKEAKWIHPQKDFLILSWVEFITELASIYSGSNLCKVQKDAFQDAPGFKNCWSISCLKVHSVKDDWLLVSAHYADCASLESLAPNAAIRWKNRQNELLIDFDY